MLQVKSVCAEVADSISWRQFTRIGIDGRVPHPTTLMKITARCGSEVVEQLNEALLAKATEARLLRVGKVRADTTVVSANVDYPTDAGLLAKAVRRIGRIVRRVKAAGAATRTRCPDHSRAAGRRARQIASKLQLCGAQAKDEAKRAIAKATAALAKLAEASAHDAEAVLRNASRALRAATGRRAGRLRRAVHELTATIDVTADVTAVVVAQARFRLAGVMPAAATRVVSAHDRDARPIVRGRLGKPVEFAYKAQVLNNEDGVIIDHTVEQGNPADARQLAPAIARVTHRAGRPPGAVTADRGYGEARVDTDAMKERASAPRDSHPRATLGLFTSTTTREALWTSMTAGSLSG